MKLNSLDSFDSNFYILDSQDANDHIKIISVTFLTNVTKLNMSITHENPFLTNWGTESVRKKYTQIDYFEEVTFENM